LFLSFYTPIQTCSARILHLDCYIPHVLSHFPHFLFSGPAQRVCRQPHRTGPRHFGGLKIFFFGSIKLKMVKYMCAE
jgi:hypothetical protein